MSNNERSLFGGDLRNIQQRRRGVSLSTTEHPPPQNHQLGPPLGPQGGAEYQGWAKPVELENLSLDFRQQPAFRDSYMQSDSEPHTPMEQLPSAMPEFSTMHRFGSVSSIATTDDEEPINEIQYPWTEQQDLLVKHMYDDLVNDPQTAPFSGPYPPSGVVHRVAKDALRMAKHRKVYFPHSMNAVRHRIIVLFHAEPESPQLPEQYSIPADYFSMAVDAKQSQQQQQDEFEFTDVMGPRRHSIEDKWTPSSTSARAGVASLGQGLAPPFKEPIREPDVAASNNPLGLSEEDVVNIVAKRKRDSLRMKRGVR